jgi:hypothetical protein
MTLVVGAARRLAVDGDQIVPAGPAFLDPAHETACEQLRVETVDERLQTADARDLIMKRRESAQKIQVKLAPCNVTSSNTGACQKQQHSASGYTIRQGSRPSASFENCLRRTATRDRGISFTGEARLELLGNPVSSMIQTLIGACRVIDGTTSSRTLASTSSSDPRRRTQVNAPEGENFVLTVRT